MGADTRIVEQRLAIGRTDSRCSGLLQLAADRGYLLQLLNGSLMAVQCRLDSLNGSALTFGNFVQLIGVLLFLLK